MAVFSAATLLFVRRLRIEERELEAGGLNYRVVAAATDRR